MMGDSMYEARLSCSETVFGRYSIKRHETGYFLYFRGETDFDDGPLKTLTDAKSKAQTHFESKLKQMLNREI